MFVKLTVFRQNFFQVLRGTSFWTHRFVQLFEYPPGYKNPLEEKKVFEEFKNSSLVWVRIRTHIRTYACTYRRTYAYVYTCIYVYVRTRVHMHTHGRARLHMCMHMYGRAYTCVHTYTYAHTDARAGKPNSILKKSTNKNQLGKNQLIKRA